MTPSREIETEIRYLPSEEGGRNSEIFSGYRGQFYYEGEDYDGIEFFPDLAEGTAFIPGQWVRAHKPKTMGCERWRSKV